MKKLTAVLMMTFFGVLGFVMEKPSTAIAQSHCVPALPGTIAWWSGDGNANDAVGGYNGTLKNGTTFTEGKVCQAFSFDGVDDFIDLGTANIIGSGNAPFSISLWIFPTRRPTGFFYLLMRLRQDTQFLFGVNSDFIVTGDYFGWGFRGESKQWWIPFDHSALLNQWSHVTVIYNGGSKSDPASVVFFINGVQLNGTPYNPGAVGGSCNDNAIGSDVSAAPCEGTLAPFQGFMDEVQIFNRVLSQTEVQQIITKANTCTCGAITVAIDIKPGSFPNSINLSSAGVIPVAILSSDTFNAPAEVNPDTLTLAGARVRVAGKSGKFLCHSEEVNGDGRLDLVCQFENDLNAEVGDSIAVLEGETFDGSLIRGEDSIRIVPD